MKKPTQAETSPEGVESSERGTALIIVTIVMLMLAMLAVTVTTTSTMRSRSSMEAGLLETARAGAEAGVAFKMIEVETSPDPDNPDLSSLGPHNGASQRPAMAVPGGSVTVYVYELGKDGIDNDGVDGTDTAKELNLLRLISTFTSTRPIGFHKGTGNPKFLTYRIEAYITSKVHEAFYKAIYVGNFNGFPNQMTLGPSDGNATTYSWDESAFVDEDTVLKEMELGIDFNGDGDMTDQPKISEVALMAGWAGFTENTGTTYRIDLNKNGNYGETYTNSLPYGWAAPAGSETPPANWETKAQDNGDHVEGDVYVKGDAVLRNDTLMWGNLDTTGNVYGDVVTGTVTPNAPEIKPPDLHSKDYAALAVASGGYVVDSSNAANIDNQRWYPGNSGATFYGNAPAAADQDNGVVHMGPNSSAGSIGFNSGDSGKLFMVKGNLWLHTDKDKKLVMPGGQNLVITIVVEGNFYIGDDLDYNNNQSGVLFLVKGKTDDPNTTEREDESFLDVNKNYVYDAGEPLINDDGDGVYEGPKEGQGNIYFMDPLFGTGGVTDGFMYAENNAYINPPVASSAFSKDSDRIYGVKGFLSSGGIFDLGVRASGSDYVNYKVQYDPRIENGQLTFTGIPDALGSGYSGLKVVSWRSVSGATAAPDGLATGGDPDTAWTDPTGK